MTVGTPRGKHAEAGPEAGPFWPCSVPVPSWWRKAALWQAPGASVQAVFPLTYHIGELPKKSSSATKVASSEEKTPELEFQEALRDLKISWIPK